MSNGYVDTIFQRICENINSNTKPGMIIASPSSDPDYKYHWIRDSALVMRPIVDLYKNTKHSKYFHLILNYIENESKLQKIKSESELGEPKYNINGTVYDKPWGRPQNDGPALRSIILFKFLDIIKHNYETLIENLIIPIIRKDIYYIIDNFDKPCFDIWEELNGWHFYTRIVQLKCLKESMVHFKYLDDENLTLHNIKDTYDKLAESINDHINDKMIISSFDVNGNIIKYEDSANILAYCHIDYDEDIIKLFPLNLIEHTAEELLTYFRNKYNNDSITLIGRYKNDKYYDGQIWILCSLALAQYYVNLYCNFNKCLTKYPIHRVKSNPFNGYIQKANEILEFILTLDENLILPEQLNPNTLEFISAKKLTWNYSELYNLIKLLM